MFNQVLQRLQQILSVGIVLGLVVLAWILSPYAGLSAVAVGTVLLLWLQRRGYFRLAAAPAAGPAIDLDAAKSLVTQMLRVLTRVQVSYLCREFENRSASRRWLKNALPAAFQGSLDELHSNLENARMGVDVPALRLARRIVEQRPALDRLERALEEAAREKPGYTVAHPLLFVVTEDLSAQEEREPGLVVLAGWDPTRPTLLPDVETLTLYSDVEDETRVRGQTSLPSVLRALGGAIKRLRDGAPVYAAEAVADPGRMGVPVDKVPLGFTVSPADLLVEQGG